VTALAQARAAARRSRDWPTADRLKAEIEAAGWRVVDAGTLYDLEPAVAPDVVIGGIVRHGSSASVPSRLDDEPVGTASVVLVASDRPEDLARALRALVDHAPAGTQLVVVANDPADAQAEALLALDATDPGSPGVITDVVWSSRRLGHADALNAAMRRCSAPVVVLMDTTIEPRGDVVMPLVDALEDPGVAVAGPFGLVSPDLRRWEPAPEGATDVDAISGELMAFRRDDVAARGPLDVRFDDPAYLDAWWSLVLRDTHDGEPGRDVPRAAKQVAGLPLVRHQRPSASLDASDDEHRARRNRYRLLKRFATRRDLLVAPGS
jgi:hypothetical protein